MYICVCVCVYICVCVCVYIYVCVCIYINMNEELICKNRTQFLTIFKNHVFSLRTPSNLNQTAVGLF